MSIVIPSARLVVPRVEECLSPLETYIDGAVFTVTGGVAHAIGYVERVHPQETVCHEVIRIHMPIEGMVVSVMRAQALFLGGRGAH